MFENVEDIRPRRLRGHPGFDELTLPDLYAVRHTYPGEKRLIDF